jgi:hypothetical protein
VFGTKIFITYGEHDMAENIVHLVLARVPGAPEGVKGISLFVVPKFLVNKPTAAWARATTRTASASSTRWASRPAPRRCCSYGDHGGAVGYLVGQENRGLEYMFIMMNAARFGVGVQGIAIAERAYQKAVQLRPRPRAEPPRGRQHERQRRHHPPPRCAPHADDHARLHRGLPRHGQWRPLPPTTPRTTIPTPRCASRTRPSTNSWCRWSRATAPR